MTADTVMAHRHPTSAAPLAAPSVGTALSSRDRALLRAVAAGRCVLSGECGNPLTIDGLCCADQFASARLSGAGLIATAGPVPAPVALTPAGRAVLAASRGVTAGNGARAPAWT
jgi:hypothetical protein